MHVDYLTGGLYLIFKLIVTIKLHLFANYFRDTERLVNW